MKKYILFVLLFCEYSLANCNMAWVNSQSVYAPPIFATLDSDQTAEFHVSGRVPDTVGQIWTVAGNDNGGTGKNAWLQTSYYMSVPEGWITDSRGFKYRIRNVGGAFTPESDPSFQMPGRKIYKSVYNEIGGRISACSPAGFSVPWIPGSMQPATNVNFDIEVAADRLFAGNYKLEIPVQLTLLEKINENAVFTSGGAETKEGLRKSPINYVVVNLNVLSKCELDTQSVNLEHGVLNPGNKINTTKPVRIGVSCKNGAEVSVSVKGTEPYEEVNNTKCGDSGYCELLINDKSSQKFSIVSGEKIYVDVTSTYHPINDRWSAGEFSGAGVVAFSFD